MMKKMRFALLFTVLTAVVVALATVMSSAATYLGDINKDGKVNSSDARILLRVAARLDILTDEEAKIADMDGNGKINSADARIALRTAAKLQDLVELTESADPTVTETEAPTPSSIVVPTLPPKPTEPVVDDPTTATEPPATDPVVEQPTTVTEPPTTEPVVEKPTTTEPVVDEPTTTEPVIEEPTTTEPVVEEPTTAAEPTGEIIVDTECYINAVVCEYDGDDTTEQQIEFAFQTKKENKKTVRYYYTRSATLFPGHDIGMLIREKAPLVGDIKQDYYLINYDTNEYMCLDSSVADIAGGDVGSGIDFSDTFEIRIFTSLGGFNAVEQVVNDNLYYVVTLVADDGSSQKYYLHQLDGRDFYEPGIIENYDVEGKMISSIQINAYEPDPSDYVNVPSMNGFTITALNMMFNIEKMMSFMQAIGIS